MSNKPITGSQAFDCLVVSWTINAPYTSATVTAALSGSSAGNGILSATQPTWSPDLPFNTGSGQNASVLTACTIGITVPVSGGQNGSLDAQTLVGTCSGNTESFNETNLQLVEWTASGSVIPPGGARR